MTPASHKKITVLGAGSFGLSLAHTLALKGHDITLWGRSKEVLEEIRSQHRNTHYLPGITLASMNVEPDLEKAIAQADILIFAIPAQFVRTILEKIKNKISAKTLLVNTAKGIEQNTLLTMSGIFSDVCGENIKQRYIIISGPTFAKELAENQPSSAVVASFSQEAALSIQHALSSHFFKLYTNDDVIGVELGGALKNVMAIATGIVEGLGFGFNTRAGLITRCLNEMTRLGVAMGANPLTFAGLSGMGDLILTCTGDLSRNRQVGIDLGRGKTLQEIINSRKSVAEGVATAKSVHELAKKYKIDMPNSEYVYKILYENLSPAQALKEISMRGLKGELEGL